MSAATPPKDTTGTREPTALDALAEAHLEAALALDPLAATVAGVAGHDGEVTDVSPDGHDARADLARATLAAVDAAAVVDAVDAVTAAALRERLGLQVELAAAGLDRGGCAMVNVIASPLQAVRDAFDLMTLADEAGWSHVAARLRGWGYVRAQI